MKVRLDNQKEKSCSKEEPAGGLAAMLSAVALVAMLGGTAPAAAGNGLTATSQALFDAVQGAGGDFIVACPNIELPNGTLSLDGKCGAEGDEPVLGAFGDVTELRILQDGPLTPDKVVNGTAFGGLTGTFTNGTASGDVVCWTFRRPSPKRSESSDALVCAKVLPDPGGLLRSPSFCGIGNKPREMKIQPIQTMGSSVCTDVAARVGLPEDGLAYLFAADTLKLAQQGSATVTTCPGFTAQCVDPANLALNGVTVRSTRSLSAYDGDPCYGSYCLWK